ncbi:HPr family phosphocarrier protein [Desulfobacter latus]|uniref:HPr family phosphocarrier protein n=1 Tax=Desulfobacter latus TaxID=2292 RepID=A0A850T1J3_9BACT|nr:HPr family phosphocarrier protein [Desulfobacter latus]NWH05583.1 HPr family phosphocarrier protein [Desulfobacter latus]
MNINLDFQYSVFRQTAVVNALGMHARPAALIAGMTQDAVGDIWLSDGKSIVDATSVIEILSLCAVTGTKVSIFTEKEEDSALADKIKNFFDIGFGESQLPLG